MILDKYNINGFVFGEIGVNTINVFIKLKIFLFLSLFITITSLVFFMMDNFLEEERYKELKETNKEFLKQIIEK